LLHVWEIQAAPRALNAHDPTCCPSLCVQQQQYTQRCDRHAQFSNALSPWGNASQSWGSLARLGSPPEGPDSAPPGASLTSLSCWAIDGAAVTPPLSGISSSMSAVAVPCGAHPAPPRARKSTGLPERRCARLFSSENYIQPITAVQLLHSWLFC
jgi:hypothetical protein